MIAITKYIIGNGERRKSSLMRRISPKDKIVEQFIKDFNIKGPKVTLDNVSKEIHVSKKTIYKYFPTKVDIYLYILYTAREEVKEKQKLIYEDKTLSLEDKIRNILIIKTDKEKQIDLSKLQTLCEVEPVFYHELLKSYEIQWKYFRLLVEEAIAKKLMREDTDVDLLIMMLSTSYEALYSSEYLKKKGISYSAAIERIANQLLDGSFTKGKEK